MDFQIEARIAEYQVAHLEEIIHSRHGDPIQNLVLYNGAPNQGGTKLEKGSTITMEKMGAKTIYYDFFPPFDPFLNRVLAAQLFATNQKITLPTFEDGSKPTINPAQLRWSKTEKYDPHTLRKMEAEAAAAAEAARLKAEEEARIKAAEEAKAQAAKAAKAAEKAEKAAKKAEAEAKAKAEAEKEAAALKARKEKEEQKRLEELAKKDPEAAKRAAEEAAAKQAAEEAAAAAAAAKAEAEKLLASLPKRAKGGAMGIFLGPTTQEFYGLKACSKDKPFLSVPCETILAEIKDKGKISDLYIIQDKVAKYAGEPKEMLFCIDPEEKYGDNGFIVCLMDADKQHFICHINAGNGIPPEIK